MHYIFTQGIFPIFELHKTCTSHLCIHLCACITMHQCITSLYKEYCTKCTSDLCRCNQYVYITTFMFININIIPGASDLSPLTLYHWPYTPCTLCHITTLSLRTSNKRSTSTGLLMIIILPFSPTARVCKMFLYVFYIT